MQPSTPTDRNFDVQMMQYALRLAGQGLGRCWPNPSVGCVLVKHGQVIAAARTGDGGRPHAEALALQIAGSEARNATAYISLEPCAHHGQTPPCAQTLINAGISRVVIACGDSDPRVSGKGAAMLQDAGIAVDKGVLEAEALRINAGFFSRIHHNRPLLAMKLATSLDGRITNGKGQSQWITGPEARNHAHSLRARYDAILTGIGTVLADNPALTCRLSGMGKLSPVRVILDSQLRLPLESRLLETIDQAPIWVMTASDDSDKKNRLEAMGAKVAQVDSGNRGIGIQAAMAWLAGQGITRVLSEGGAALNGSLWESGLVEKLYWFRAPVVLGDTGAPALACAVDVAPSDLQRLMREDTIPLGSDLLEIYSAAIPH